MKENILIGVIFLACAFSLGVMAAGGLLPQSVLWIIAGGAVLVALAAIGAGLILGIVWLMRPRDARPNPEPYRDYRPLGDRPTWTPVDHQGPGYRIDHRPVDHHVDPWPTLEPAEDRRREISTPTRRAIQWKK